MHWYVIHTLSGSEKRVEQKILDQIKKKNMSEFFQEIKIPMIEISEVKRGKSVKTEKKCMPGYILIKMKMNDESWHLVKDVTKGTSFLGSKSTPKELSDKEVDDIFMQLEAEAKGAKKSKLYEIGEKVVINDESFEGFVGYVEEIYYDKEKLRVSVMLFGKQTMLELNFAQVKKSKD